MERDQISVTSPGLSTTAEMNQTSYIVAGSVKDALIKAKARRGDFTYYAGGTDLQVLLQQHLLAPSHIIDISQLSEIKQIAREKDFLILGGGVTLDELATNQAIVDSSVLIATAARSIATPVIRKTATLGGNLLIKNRCTFYNQSQSWRTAVGSCLRDTGDICQAVGTAKKCYSRNVSDMAPALIVLGAEIAICNHKGTVNLSLSDLYTGDGIHNHQHLDEDGILTTTRIPVRPVKTWYRKLRERGSLDFSSLTAAAAWDEKGDFRFCINGVSMAPIVIQGNWHKEGLDAIQRIARTSCQTVDNDLLALKYRKAMLPVFIKEWWMLKDG